MGVNKVQSADGEVYIDISQDTVTPDTLADGVTAHDASGEEITGTMSLLGMNDWYEIENKPFTDEGYWYLKWDGNTTGTMLEGVYRRISEVVPTKKELSKGITFNAYDGEGERTVGWEYNYKGTGVDILTIPYPDGGKFVFALIVRKAGATFSDHTFWAKGIWLTNTYVEKECRLYIHYFKRFSSAETPHRSVLNPECLPKKEELPTEEKDIFGAISELHGDIEGVNTEIANINDRIDLLHNPKVVDLEGTTWRLNDSITIDSTITCDVNFITNGTAYNKLMISSFIGVDGSALQKISYGKAINIVYENGTWDNTNFQYVTFTGGTDSTNLDLIDWCYTHGELLSINLSSLQPKVDERLNTVSKEIVGAINEIDEKIGEGGGGSLEMPQIRFGSAIYTNLEKIVNDENPLKLRVEIVGGGALQVGDQLQICAKRTYGYKNANGMPYRKQKLRQQCSYDITEEDIGKRFISIDTGFVSSWLFKNDRNSTTPNGSEIDTLSAFYLRIKRPIYKETPDGYMPIDAKFSNVIPVWKTYNFNTNRVSIK